MDQTTVTAPKVDEDEDRPGLDDRRLPGVDSPLGFAQRRSSAVDRLVK